MSDSGTPWARFDDLRAGTALRFPPPARVLTASSPEDVVPVLAEVERATAAGQWAAGYVGYEAAAGLDPALPVCPPDPDGPPLAWFGLCAPPTAVRPGRAARRPSVPAGLAPGLVRRRPPRARSTGCASTSPPATPTRST